MKDKNFKKRYKVPKTASRTALWMQKVPLAELRGIESIRLAFYGNKMDKFQLVLSFKERETVYLEPEDSFLIKFKPVPFGAAHTPIFIYEKEVK